MTHSTTSLIIGLFVATALTAPAVAGPVGYDETGQASRVVRLADVDLHTTDGAKVAARRIKDAADFLCGVDSGVMLASSDFIACRDQAIDHALASLDAPLVSAALSRPTLPIVAAR